jgi:hypothetical protein
VLHCGTQAELLHVTTPLSGWAQTLPQAPQFALSLSNLTQALLQAVKLAAQLASQPFVPHLAVPLAGVGHATPQSPQF